MRRPLLAALAILVGFSTLLAMAMDPPEGIRAFFVSYKTKLPRGERFEPIPAVSLEDTFDGLRLFDVTKSDALLVPAGRDGGALAEGTSHLHAFAIKETKVCSDTGAACQSARECNAGARCSRPKHTKRTGLEVETEFGAARVDTIRPDLLLVPSAKDLLAEPPAPSPESHLVDHFKCYRVRRSKGAAKFAEKLARVSDQFIEVQGDSDGKVFRLLQPRHLCLAVDKRGEGFKNRDAQLVCYQARPAQGQCSAESPQNALGGCKTDEQCGGERGKRDLCKKQPRHQKRTGVHVNNQFGPRTLETLRETEVCVVGLVPPGPTSSPTPGVTPTPGPTSEPTPTPGATPQPTVSPTPSPTPTPREHAPDIVSEAQTSAGTGYLYRYPVEAVDPDAGDVLTFSLEVAPSWMSIDDATGVIEGKPGDDDQGQHPVLIRVQDQAGLFDLQEFMVQVNVAVNRSPVITSAPELLPCNSPDLGFTKLWVEGNLARLVEGATASASSAYPGTPPDLVIDGNRNNQWFTAPGDAVNRCRCSPESGGIWTG